MLNYCCTEYGKLLLFMHTNFVQRQIFVVMIMALPFFISKHSIFFPDQLYLQNTKRQKTIKI